MTTDFQKSELEGKIQELVKKVEYDRTASTATSIATIGAAAVGSLFTPVAGALLGAAGAGLAANYLWKLIQEKRLLNEEVHNLESLPSEDSSNT